MLSGDGRIYKRQGESFSKRLGSGLLRGNSALKTYFSVFIVISALKLVGTDKTFSFQTIAVDEGC